MVEVRGGSLSLEPQLAAIFDSDRAGELHGKLRKLLQTILAEKRESGYFKTSIPSAGFQGNPRPLMSCRDSMNVCWVLWVFKDLMKWNVTESWVPFLCSPEGFIAHWGEEWRQNHILESSKFTEAEPQENWIRQQWLGGILLNTKACWRCCLCPGGAASHGLSTWHAHGTTRLWFLNFFF